MSFFRPLGPLLSGWLLALAVWGALAFIVSYSVVANTPLTWIEALQAPVRDWLPWTVAAPLLFRFVNRHPLGREKWLARGLAHLAVFAVIALLVPVWADYLDVRPAAGLGRFGGPLEQRFSRFGGPPEGGGPGGRPPTGEPGARSTGRGAMGRGGPPEVRLGPAGAVGIRPFFRVLSTYLLLISVAHALAYYRRAKEREASLASARLEALRMQLQPHFLFNTLNTISGLVHAEPDRADAVVTALSELLRMTLETSGERELPLREEMRMVEAYLAIMQARFDDRVRSAIEIEPETLEALVPAFILQPLVENSVRHGLEPLPGGGCVTVRARRRGEWLVVEVEDDGAGLATAAAGREGIGLGNTRARLRALHGERASLVLRPAGDRGCVVTMQLPYRVKNV